MINLDEVIINGAFYELFERIFNEDFFVVLTSLRPSARVSHLRSKKEDELTPEESEELIAANLELAKIMKKYTSRICYIGNLLYKKKYNGSYDDFLNYLATCDASDFMDADIISAVWQKVTNDQMVPKSVKNV